MVGNWVSPSTGSDPREEGIVSPASGQTLHFTEQFIQVQHFEFRRLNASVLKNVRRILHPSCTFLKIIFNFSFFATAWLFCLWALASAAGKRWAGATTECAVAPPPLCRYRRTEGEPGFWPHVPLSVVGQQAEQDV